MHWKSLAFTLTAFAAALPLRAEVNFEKEILPFLESKCLQCHKAPFEKDGKSVKPKAGLRLDAAWAIQAGSENGAVLVAGKSGESALYQRVTLPPEDDDFMPPKDKADPLTDAEVALLKQWIDEGAEFGEWRGNLEGKPADVSNTGKHITISETQKIYQRLAEGLAMPEEKSWESVTAAGGRVARLAQTSPLLSVDFRLAPEPATDEQILSAKVVAENLAHLDLSRSAATDGALALAAAAPRLVRLDLSNTAVGDAGLANLKELKELRYLNLHNTQVTDAGLKALEGLASLEAVYLWQSKATEAGVKALRQALPGAKINFK
ncbi:MAG: hypothetical protein JNJ70_07015 [Verrucomicrobiales bacterium]|nr:hypothetical protein [Verrucomicrobiales bacterium]